MFARITKLTPPFPSNRVNPLYEEDEGVGGEVVGAERGEDEGGGLRGGDGGSLRSSGYGSKETDSDTEEGGHGGGRRIRGGVVVRCEPRYVRGIAIGVRRSRSLEGIPPAQSTPAPPYVTSTIPRRPPLTPPSYPVKLETHDPNFVTSVKSDRPRPLPCRPCNNTLHGHPCTQPLCAEMTGS